MAKFMVELYRSAKGTPAYVKGTDSKPLVLDKVQAAIELDRWSPYFPDTITLVKVEEPAPAKVPLGYKLVATHTDGQRDKVCFADGPMRGRAWVFPDPDAAAPLMADAQAHGVHIQVVPSYEDAPNHELLKTK